MNTIVWLREDLRLLDNPALHFASQQGAVLPVFVYPEKLGGASYWWLHHSLEHLSQQFAKSNVELVLRTGNVSEILSSLATEYDCELVVWNRVYSPDGIELGSDVRSSLDKCGVKNRSFNGQLLIEPSKILTKQGTPFKVFTPFWRSCLTQLSPSEPLAAPAIKPLSSRVDSDTLDDWGLLPMKPNWALGFESTWQPGESGSQHRWTAFLEDGIKRYKERRDYPIESNTSLLSPHLAFGEISPRQLWFDVNEAMACGEVDLENGQKFLAEIGWREFSRYLLVHFPQVINAPFNTKFQEFPWVRNKAWVAAWQSGQTGYPIVDAGMRELWKTGYMHNRVRMVVASFLTKHLRSHWRVGADWFWDTLVDADIANNTASWQWAAGCGADAAPYFRIFNPILQGEKFDKAGEYVKKWVPELAKLEPRFLHKPWEADPMTLSMANVRLGETYPYPIVDHKRARADALDAYQAIKTP